LFCNGRAKTTENKYFSDAWDFLTKASRRLLHGKEARAPDYSGN
jgi:hypothetical protein